MSSVPPRHKLKYLATTTVSRWHLRAGWRRGAIMPLLAVCLPVLLLLAAFAINIAYLELARTEMYVTADAASRAAGRQLAISGDQASATAVGSNVAYQNPVAGQNLVLSSSNFVYGQAMRPSASSRYSFTPGGSVVNGVEVTINDNINLLLPNLIGLSTIAKSQTSRSNQIEVDVALVVDRSGSMAYADTEAAVYPPLPAAAPPGWWFGQPAPNPCRWRDAVSAVNTFLSIMTSTPADEYVALVTYNGSTSNDTALSDNYSLIPAAMNVYTNAFNSGATNIGGGIDAGHNAVLGTGARNYAAKVLIVLTDGIDTVHSDPIESAANCANDKIQVFTITFAAEADQATMQAVAQAGNGLHFHAATAADLTTIFNTIAHQLPILISK